MSYMFAGHYALWKGLLHHRDISTGNLMYFDLFGRKLGVLNNFDLSIDAAVDRTCARERTGTWPFMAIALIKGSDGKVNHIHGTYEVVDCGNMMPIIHTAFDAESFFWFLVWTTYRYDGGKLTRPKALKSFGSLKGHDSANAKAGFLKDADVLQLTPSHQESFDTVTELQILMDRLTGKRAQQEFGKLTDENVFKLFHDRLSLQFDNNFDDWFAEECEKIRLPRNRHGMQEQVCGKAEIWKNFPKEPRHGEKIGTIQQQSMLDSEMWIKLTSSDAYNPPKSTQV
jgi:hypothetical protein